jgi:hypothetical protein
LLIVSTIFAASDPTGDLIGLVDRGGVVSLLIILTIAGWRRWIVWGWQYDAMTLERDYWREIAMRGATVAEKAVDVARRP